MCSSNSYADRINLEFSEINTLAKPLDIGKNYILADGVYGIEKSLKDYCNIDGDYHIKAFIEHGITFSEYLETGFRVHESLPSITVSSFRKNLINNAKNSNGAYSIGPYIYYAKSLLSRNKFLEEKERLGHTLLVFPVHSTLGGTYSYDVENFCMKIKEIAKDYDSVRISLYWKDVELGNYKIYQKHGFEVVCAGYMYDSYFLSRLKSIIELSDMTISNEIGTSSAYALCLDKPHIIIPSDVEYKIGNDGKYLNTVAKDSWDKVNQTRKTHEIKQITEGLLMSNGIINSKNETLINTYCGLDELKTKKELNDIIKECENQYSVLKFYLKKPLFLKEYMRRMYRISKSRVFNRK